MDQATVIVEDGSVDPAVVDSEAGRPDHPADLEAAAVGERDG
jgi:hypothetical protein